MDKLQSPEDNFLHHKEMEVKPSGVVLELNESNTESELVFDAKKLGLLWEGILGTHTLLPLNIVHRNSALLWYLAPDFWIRGFLRGIRVTLSSAYVSFLQQARGDETTILKDTAFSCRTVINYVGGRSYGLGMEAHRLSDDMPILSYVGLMIPTDKKTRTIYKKLPSDWSMKHLEHQRSKGLQNDKIVLPSFPESHVTRQHSVNLTIHPEHVDENSHTNYKVYMFGSLVCLAEISNSSIPRDMVFVFEKESMLGDRIRFDLLIPETGSDVVYVATYKEDKRLAYCRFETEKVHSGVSKL